MQPFRHNRNGPKVGEGLCPLFGEGRAGSPSNTKSPGLRPSSKPSGILIHAAIWPQQIWAENVVGAVPLLGRGAGSPSNTMMFHLGPSNCLVTIHQRHRQDRQTGRTVLQTVAQKLRFLFLHLYLQLYVCILRARVQPTLDPYAEPFL